jgi:membrane protein required for colicin V production
MTWLDYGIIGFIAFSTLIGLLRGFVQEVFSLVGLGVALLVAFAFSDRIEPLFQNYITLPSMRRIVAFGVLFLAMLLVMALLNYILVTVVSQTGIGGTDRILGMLFGVVRGAVVMVVLVFLAGFTSFPQDPWWQGSKLVPHFQAMAKWGCRFLPDELSKLSSVCDGGRATAASAPTGPVPGRILPGVR